MSTNDPDGVQSSDRTSTAVELLLEQMTLCGPSDQLDAAVECLAATEEANGMSGAVGAQFGWPVVLATAVAAMLAGVWLGSFYLPVSDTISNSRLAAADSVRGNELTAVSFNVQAFNLLHGHSEKTEFENCGECHQEASAKNNTLSDVFEGWFYGDEHFFEVHLDGIDDCSKCHLVKVIDQDGPANEFSRLVRCSECHKVDASGFGGFQIDWRFAANRSEG